MHDVILAFLPAIFLAEYKIGYWILRHSTPQRVHFGHLGLRDYIDWHLFAALVWPALIGSIFLALPSAITIYFLARWTVQRARVRRRAGGENSALLERKHALEFSAEAARELHYKSSINLPRASKSCRPSH